jgi:hypothetical protein
MPEIEIDEEKIAELKAISEITRVLAEKPEILKDISDEMKKISKEYESRMKNTVSKMIAENVDIAVADIEKIYPQWAWHVHQYWYWYWDWVIPPWTVWGPYRELPHRMKSKEG